MKGKVIAIVDEKEKEIMRKLDLKINTFRELKLSLGQSALASFELDEIKSRLNKDLMECEKNIQNWWDSILKKYKIEPDIDVSKIRLFFDSNELIL